MSANMANAIAGLGLLAFYAIAVVAGFYLIGWLTEPRPEGDKEAGDE